MKEDTLKCFERSPKGDIKEADWSHGSVMIHAHMDNLEETRTFVINNKKPKHSYCVALTEKNARRIFNRRNI